MPFSSKHFSSDSCVKFHLHFNPYNLSHLTWGEVPLLKICCLGTQFSIVILSKCLPVFCMESVFCFYFCRYAQKRCIIWKTYTFLVFFLTITLLNKSSNYLKNLFRSENTGKFLFRDLSTPTNNIYCKSQHGALMNRFQVMMTPIGWREFPTIFWSETKSWWKIMNIRSYTC